MENKTVKELREDELEEVVVLLFLKKSDVKLPIINLLN